MNAPQGESGHIIFVFVYGTFSGGFQYCLKMYAFDLSKSRTFNRIWPIFQAFQGISVMVGMPVLSNNLSGCFLILAAVTLVMGDRVKNYLREAYISIFL